MATKYADHKILHVDFNSFFASAEQQANPYLRGRSIGVGGKHDTKGIIAAASREAKQRGIKTAMSVWDAKRLDPTMLIINGDSRKYAEFSNRLLNILERQGGIVEPYSIDEAFLDVSNIVQDWFDALAIALRIRDAVRAEIGESVTVSIGIAPNKLLAKMASDAEKPNGLSLVYPSKKDRYDFLNTRALDDIPGIGPCISRRLRELGIETVSSLRIAKLPFLMRHFKQYGLFLYNASRGLDNTRVDNTQELEKSIGHSYTLPRQTMDMAIVRQTLLNLADRVGWRLRKRGLAARAYTAIVRFDDLRVVAQQGQLPAPTANGLDLFQAAWQTIQKLIFTYSTHQRVSVRLVGITAHKLLPRHVQLTHSRQQQKHTDILPWLDQIQHRYGARSWVRASTLTARLKERANGLHLDHVD